MRLQLRLPSLIATFIAVLNVCGRVSCRSDTMLEVLAKGMLEEFCEYEEKTGLLFTCIGDRMIAKYPVILTFYEECPRQAAPRLGFELPAESSTVTIREMCRLVNNNSVSDILLAAWTVFHNNLNPLSACPQSKKIADMVQTAIDGFVSYGGQIFADIREVYMICKKEDEEFRARKVHMNRLKQCMVELEHGKNSRYLR